MPKKQKSYFLTSDSFCLIASHIYLSTYFLIFTKSSPISNTGLTQGSAAQEGRVMGPLLVLVCPRFREIVIVTRKTVSFLCSFNNFLLI